jgi:hypothetical protein
MHPYSTHEDAEYRAAIAAASEEASRARNDARRQPTRRGSPIYTEQGRICRFCGSTMDAAGNCVPQYQCDGVL